MRNFEILFDHGEPSPVENESTEAYGKLGFPEPSADRPWIYSNFVQSIDGITSLLGRFGAGRDIAQSEEDRWLMDLLRVHADALILGLHTLAFERLYMGNPRGPIFKIANAELLAYREELGRSKLKVVFITNSADLELQQFRIFESDLVDSFVVTTDAGASKLRAQKHPSCTIIEAGKWPRVDLQLMVKKLRHELGVRHLLCEGGPTFYGSMAKADLIDEKFVTVAPFEVGHAAPSEQEMAEFDKARLRPTTFSGPGFTKETMSKWKWMSCRKIEDHEFNRYRRIR